MWSSSTMVEETSSSSLGIELQKLIEKTDSSADDDEEILFPSRRIEQNTINPIEIKNTRRPYLGVILATLSAIFFSLCSVVVKYLDDIDPIQLAAYRFVGILLPSIPIGVYKDEKFFPKGKRGMLILRGVFGATALVLSFYAIRYMPLGDASTIIFSRPVFVILFARLFLNEPCGMHNIIPVTMTMIGVVFIARPTFIFGVDSRDDFDFNQPRAADFWSPIAAITSTLVGANIIVLLRVLKGVHYSVILFNFGWVALVMTVSISFYLGVFCLPTCGRDRWLVVGVGIFSFLGQFLLTKATKYDDAGPISIARSTDIVFAFGWQILFFNDIPSVYSVLGALLVLMSVLLIGIRKWVITLPDNSTMRKRLRILI